MTETRVATCRVLDDVLKAKKSDLVVGEEEWEADHFLRENPDLKRGAFAWLTYFVGWLPNPGAGPLEAVLTADYNAEMIEHIERYSTGHSEAIVTESLAASEAFVRGISSACVYVNASTRFTDGGEFGFGAGIANLPARLHARGPVGLADITPTK